MKTQITRRNAMMIGGSLPMILAVPAMAQDAAPQAAPLGRAHSFTLGRFQVATLLAGSGMREDPFGTFGLNAEKADFEKISAQNFIPSDKAGSSMTPTLVRAGDAVILFDAGMVPAQTVASLAQAGVLPDQVTHVVLTHMHGDHVGGLMQGETPTFPNAELIVPKAENDYWAANPSDAYDAKVKPLIGKARQIGDGDEIAPGITAEAAHGHTAGHTTYLLESEGQRLLISGDSFTHYVYSVQRPEWQVRFDMDKEQGIAARKAVLVRLANEAIPFVGYHMPYPAVGFIAPNSAGSYRYVPATYQLG
ncbi:MAG: MBL fold metallo-hydrolase [Paracoccus sp. (in: a-proteobacteria)]|uniref:MBL fold metallo-hydrolase n=1 Tax=Paracoccus sp. TaxID=267 RepID=UPI0039E3CCE1